MTDDRDLRISRALQALCEHMAEIVEQEAGEPTMVALLVMPYGEGESADFQYISNAPREFMHSALKSLVAKWDSGAPSIPPHEKQ